jgi:hypothetical protein
MKPDPRMRPLLVLFTLAAAALLAAGPANATGSTPPPTYTYRIPVPGLAPTPSVTTQTIAYTGVLQAITPPDGAKTMQVFLWGAGGGSANTGHGGGGSAASTYGGAGGGGGFVTFSLPVAAGATYAVAVGQGGLAPQAVGVPPASTSYTGYSYAGEGGGSTKFYLNGAPVAIAGAGGGGGGGGDNMNYPTGGSGGAGGGTAGTLGTTNSGAAGAAGTILSGIGGNSQSCSSGCTQAWPDGSIAPISSGYLATSSAYHWAGGGGGGYRGGAGGACGSPSYSGTCAGGGGGSSWVDPSIAATATLQAGNGTTPGGVGSPHYAPGVAVGGGATTTGVGHAGGNGYAVIVYSY